MTLKIEHDLTTHRFFTIVENQECILQYRPLEDRKTLDYFSTFVPSALRGRHIAQDIVKFALEYAKANHFKVIPSCPFVKRYIDSTPEYQSLLG